MTKHFTWQQAILDGSCELPSTTRYVMLVIGTYMNAHGTGAWPSITTICEASRLSRSSVIRSIGVAEELGWLKVVRRRKSDGNNESNIYQIGYPGVTETLPLVSQRNQPSVTKQLGWFHGDTQTPHRTPQGTPNLMSGKPDAVDNSKEEKAEQNAQAGAIEIVRTLNIHADKHYKPVPSTLKLIRARMKEYTLLEIAEVVERKCKEWKGTKMEQYLRPETLFNATKFAGYAGQRGMECYSTAIDDGKDCAKWWESSAAISSMGAKLGVHAKTTEAFWQYKCRVAKASNQREAMDAILADMIRTENAAYEATAKYFGVATNGHK